MNDIGKELYERVRADFERRLAAEKHPPKDMRGVSDYSARVGRYLAEAIAANVTEDALPDGRLYYNIAESILTPTLRTNYELVNDTAAEVQRLLDERQGLHIKPARADYPEERVHAMIGAASEEGIEFDRALRRMTSPAENITQSFADDFMQANAAQRSKAGFDTFIERQGGVKCCPWCAGLVGVFEYPKGLPKEVFARHDNCTCSVTYGTKGGARQNVWTKAKWNVPPVQEPHRMTAEEAAEKGAFAEPRRLTKSSSGDIIKSESQWLPRKEHMPPEQFYELREYGNKYEIAFSGLKRSDSDPRLIREAVEAAGKVLTRYPELQRNKYGQVTFNISQSMQDEDYAYVNSVRPNVIHLNANAYRNLEILRADYNKFVESGHFPKGTNYNSITVHELGHLYQHIHNISNEEILAIAKQAAQTYDDKELFKYLSDKLSKYSAAFADGSEIISEVFADYFTSNSPTEFSNNFIKILEKERDKYAD